jgi:hypothetical protein
VNWYYVAAAGNEGDSRNPGIILRVPAPEIEAAVMKALHQQLPEAFVGTGDELSNDACCSLLEEHLERVTIRGDMLEISAWVSDASGSQTITVVTFLIHPQTADHLP